jgi:ribonuclease J
MMSFRTSMAAEVERAGILKGARAAWKMWSGYLEGDDGRWTRNASRSRHPALHHPCLRARIGRGPAAAGAGDRPRRVVPIHTAPPERYPELFDNVEAHGDG